jgi:hypothetical protein
MRQLAEIRGTSLDYQRIASYGMYELQESMSIPAPSWSSSQLQIAIASSVDTNSTVGCG